jgi:hypothetical protein
MSEIATSQEQDLRDLAEQDPPSPDEFCHIVDASGTTYYCGKPHKRGVTCKKYEGEAICPTCGRPTCPTCAVRSDLAVRLEGT